MCLRLWLSTLLARLGRPQDPSIRDIAQQISMDPAFRQMAGTLAHASSAAGDSPATPAVDPAAYMQAMQGMMANPEFMQMAERLGTQMMQARRAARRRARAGGVRGTPLSS